MKTGLRLNEDRVDVMEKRLRVLKKGVRRIVKRDHMNV